MNCGTLTDQTKPLCRFSEKSMEPFLRKVFDQNRKVFFFRFVDGVLFPLVQLLTQSCSSLRGGGLFGDEHDRPHSPVSME